MEQQTVGDETESYTGNQAANSACNGVAKAERFFAAALKTGRDSLQSAQDRAVRSAKATDRLIRDNPYAALGVAVGVGALVGFLISRRK
ncbi:MAG TPA: hypothetical protein VMF06_13800 [Candidatus Limnocylindria bacterium]|jgi:ElaB/YqjD/DUF883 family membrane-anchored ribosome-binding protein|nr:hypothetical protein [Candidatus Limnocylindria bacterium]